MVWSRASAEKFPGGPTEKLPKNSKKVRKIALLNLFQRGGGNGKKDQKIAKTPKNSTFKPLSAIYLYHV